MGIGRLLVVVADADVRRSLTFAFEAEGFAVTALGALPAPSWTRSNRFDCTILDQQILKGPRHESIAFCIGAHPVVLLAATPVEWLVEWVWRVVETPVVEDTLLTAVSRATLPIQRPTPSFPPRV